jgi:hypothetical protein
LQVEAPHAKVPHDFVVKLHAPAPLQPAGSDSVLVVHEAAVEQVVVPPG